VEAEWHVLVTINCRNTVVLKELGSGAYIVMVIFAIDYFMATITRVLVLKFLDFNKDLWVHVD
jgi:hypothetical protein